MRAIRRAPSWRTLCRMARAVSALVTAAMPGRSIPGRDEGLSRVRLGAMGRSFGSAYASRSSGCRRRDTTELAGST